MRERTVIAVVTSSVTEEPDITLDGRPIGDFVTDDDPEGTGDVFTAPWGEWRPFLLSLLGEGPSVVTAMLPGRIALASCASCGDSSCGILFSAELVRNGEIVQWKDSRWESETLRPLPPPSTLLGRLSLRLGFGVTDEFAGWCPNGELVRTLTFEREQYDGAIREALRLT
ncbi:hypothetical protein [Rathayibacter sp. VKM Ac-2805]|uniref:hypothetical protein n=1 Tax=Rathayibacter sp. VKM Ac-2805 TaxID=2609258 RepID=UPI00131FBF89|nr:hypothetical protein [Rathayibacter sp. VKM Ac-2805]QHC72657.1 hypothetical protein GSU40_02385 [Rathayibacter sp. VKM Ac-2805]